MRSFWSFVGTRKPNRTCHHRSHARIGLEQLEDRAVPAIAHPDFVLFHPASGNAVPHATSAPTGVTPAVMRHAYGVDATLFGSVVGDGTGQTIAIIDAYDAPTIVNDLAAFDRQFGLPGTTAAAVNGFLTRINQNGGSTLPAADARGGWGVETSLDVEWAHVIAPGARILLVEASSASDTDLNAAINTARNYAGVSVISMSFGSDEYSGAYADDSLYTTPAGHNGVTFVASSGDSGAYSYSSRTTRTVSYPASSANVVAVGGTRLTTGTGGTYVSESAWGSGTSSWTSGGAGGGISAYEPQPAYQRGVVTQTTTRRAVPDIAFDADPASGVPVYDSYDNGASTPWLQVGGTSLAAPMWAGVFALVNQDRALNGLGSLNGSSETLPRLYQLPARDFHDITTGSNGYSAGTGYDLVTGRGTPIVNLLVPDLAGTPTTPTPILGGFTVSPTSVTIGNPITLTASNVTEAGGTISSVRFYLESNGTAGLQSTGDILLGSGTANGSTWTLTASTTSLTAGSYTLYAIATDTSGNSSAVASTTLRVTATASSPTIGSFTVSPTSATVGSTVVLTAANVTSPNGSISTVTFYRESGGGTGLQVGTDTVVGTAAWNGSSWTLSTAATGLAAGTYTYYAVATDSAGQSSAASSVTLTLTAATTQTATATSLSAGRVRYYRNGTASVVLTARVTAASGTVPAGSVVDLIYNGSILTTGKVQIVNGAAQVSFTVTFATYSLVSWDYYTFTAAFEGTSKYAPSKSSSLTVAV